jgi:hypothetical protein
MRLIFCRFRFVRNFTLFGQPRTHVDESAAIAAERPVLRCLRPFHGAPTGGTFDYRDQAQQVNRNGTSTST